MPMSWDESTPGDGDLLSQGASAIRALKAQFAEWIAVSVYWPGSGGGSAASAGEMKLGSFRAGYEAASVVSQSDYSGRLLFASDTSRLYLLHSSTDSLNVAGCGVEHPQSLVTSARWVVSRGTITIGNTANFGVTYNGLPIVMVSLTTTLKTPVYPIAVTTGGISTAQHTPSGYSCTDDRGWVVELGAVVDWLSIGSVSF